MGLKEVEQALLNQKTKGAENNIFEVISNALEIPVETVHRVLYAAYCFDGVSLQHIPWEHFLPNDDLRQAIHNAMDAGYVRMYVGNAIRRGSAIAVGVGLLVPPQTPEKICDGCPERMQCIAESLSTPEKCISDRNAIVSVTPLKLNKNTVEVETTHPAGRYTVPLYSINPAMKRFP